MNIHLQWPRLFMTTVFLGLLLVSSESGAGAAENKSKEKPNFVFILIDDLGWADVGCYGSTFHRTPNIDRLAETGMKFTDGYAACPVCSPTRASIMTGKYPARLNLTNYLVGKRKDPESPILPAEYVHQLPLKETTIPEALKQAGYVAGHFGKWHLGKEPYYPEKQGFDFNFGGTHSGMPRAFFYPQWKGNPPVEGEKGEYLPDLMSKEAVKFIERNQEEPFFLYLSHYAVHIPIQAKKDVIAKYRKRIDPENPQQNPIYAGMVEAIDDSVGRVLETLEKNNLADNTVVIFMSDNGGLSVKEGPHTPATSNAPLRDGKGYLYEGGIREPWIIRWPGVTEPGSVSREPVISNDFFPTIVEMVGLEASKWEHDGVSLVPLLKQNGSIDREALYWHYPHFSNQGGRPGGAVRKGRYKLIERYENDRLELYDLKKDLGEQKNLAEEMPEKTRELQVMLKQWRKSVDANMPLPNPDYSASEKTSSR